jgi:hypothetical protein
MSKMASHRSFGHLQPKLWAKEGPRVKLAVWLPTTKSRESTSSRRLQIECDEALESSRGELQLWFRLHSNQRSEPRVVSVQSPKSPTRDSFGTPPWSPGKMCHSDVAPAGSCREYYMGEGGGFPRVRAVMSQVCQSARGLSQHPRVFPNVN